MKRKEWRNFSWKTLEMMGENLWNKTLMENTSSKKQIKNTTTKAGLCNQMRLFECKIDLPDVINRTEFVPNSWLVDTFFARLHHLNKQFTKLWKLTRIFWIIQKCDATVKEYKLLNFYSQVLLTTNRNSGQRRPTIHWSIRSTIQDPKYSYLFDFYKLFLLWSFCFHFFFKLKV